MHQYCFILGNNPTLSVWEITAVLNSRGIDFSFDELHPGCLFLTLKKALRASFLERLGGTIKIVEVLHEVNRKDWSLEYLLEKLKHKERVVFGFSVYSCGQMLSRKAISDVFKRVNALAMELKKELKSGGHSVRFVASRDMALSSIVVESNHLLVESGEWVWLAGQDGIRLGRTIASQKSFWYSWRDFGRPARDAKSGMLPPKLAKILVNISGANPPGGVLLDPFCGSGTVLQEAGIMGFTRLFGLDRDPDALRRSRENWQWLEKEGVIVPHGQWFLNYILGEAQLLSHALPPKSIDVIVSEGYLGEPMKKVSLNEIHSRVEELSELYYNSFAQFKKILRPGGRVAMTFPAFLTGEHALHGRHPSSPGQHRGPLKFYLPIVRQISQLGFQPVLAFPANARKSDVLEVTERGSVLYGRPDQKVWREVFVWKLN